LIVLVPAWHANGEPVFGRPSGIYGSLPIRLRLDT
jgi:hypothetical protein